MHHQIIQHNKFCLSKYFLIKTRCKKKRLREHFKLILCCVRERSLVVSNLRSDTKDSWFELGWYLCVEVSSPQQSPGQCLSAGKAGGSGSEELKNEMPSSFPCSPVICECS